LLGGVTVVRGEARAVAGDGAKQVQFRAIPYCLWDNRQPGPMVVWLPEDAEH
jgi:DUF1680 family protein